MFLYRCAKVPTRSPEFDAALARQISGTLTWCVFSTTDTGHMEAGLAACALAPPTGKVPGYSTREERARRIPGSVGAGLLAALMALPLSALAHAETLTEAMAAAQAHHPMLKAEQARKRAAAAGIDIARSGYFPDVSATGEIAATNSDIRFGNGQISTASGLNPAWDYSVSAEQTLFDGFRTSSAVDEALAEDSAASASVLGAEQSVLLEAVRAYADVLRDRTVQVLRKRDVDMLDDQVKAAQTSLSKGASTVTDVAQARSRRAQATAELITAMAEAEVSTAEYERVVGYPPSHLKRPSLPEALLPKSLQATIDASDGFDPLTRRAQFRAKAAKFAVDRLRADAFPQVKARVALEGSRGHLTNTDDRDVASIGLRVTVPIFDGGANSARVTQANAINTALTEEARGASERARSGAMAAWRRWSAARERLASERDAVDQSRQALDGIRQEVRAGQKSMIESLDAQRQLVATEVAANVSERDLLVESYALLAATGKLSSGLPIGEADAAATKPAAARDTLSSNPIKLDGAKGWLASTNAVQ